MQLLHSESVLSNCPKAKKKTSIPYGPYEKLMIVYIDVGSGKVHGVRAPQFSRSWARRPLACNVVAFLETKIIRKINDSSDFRRSKFQSFPEEHAPGPP